LDRQFDALGIVFEAGKPRDRYLGQVMVDSAIALIPVPKETAKAS
jgi:hypothetical protein